MSTRATKDNVQEQGEDAHDDSETKELKRAWRALTPQASLAAWIDVVKMAKLGKVNEQVFVFAKAEAERRKNEWVAQGLVTMTANGCMIPKSSEERKSSPLGQERKR